MAESSDLLSERNQMAPTINLVDELTLGNFKSISIPQKLPFRPITLIYGPNGAGKSSVIQALSWLRNLQDGSWTKDFQRYVRNHQFESRHPCLNKAAPDIHKSVQRPEPKSSCSLDIVDQPKVSAGKKRAGIGEIGA